MTQKKSLRRKKACWAFSGNKREIKIVEAIADDGYGDDRGKISA